MQQLVGSNRYIILPEPNGVSYKMLEKIIGMLTYACKIWVLTGNDILYTKDFSKQTINYPTKHT